MSTQTRQLIVEIGLELAKLQVIVLAGGFIALLAMISLLPR